MVRWTRVIAIAGLAAAALSLTACERTITNVESDTQALACTDCHVSNNLITGKQSQWAESGHGTGETFIEEGVRNSCAGCHSGNAFQERAGDCLDTWIFHRHTSLRSYGGRSLTSPRSPHCAHCACALIAVKAA